MDLFRRIGADSEQITQRAQGRQSGEGKLRGKGESRRWANAVGTVEDNFLAGMSFIYCPPFVAARCAWILIMGVPSSLLTFFIACIQNYAYLHAYFGVHLFLFRFKYAFDPFLHFSDFHSRWYWRESCWRFFRLTAKMFSVSGWWGSSARKNNREYFFLNECMNVL